jgi:RNA polymerase sigma-70 factor, ECF subfamily
MRGDERQEALWVLRAQCGDREALESLLRSVQPALRRYLTRLVGLPDADDVLQDSLLLIARKLSSLHEPERFRSWAFRVANREGIHHLEKRRRWSDHLKPDVVVDDVPAIGTEIDAGRIVNLLQAYEISAPCSAVLTLHFDEQMPLAQVAAVLEIPLGTVKSRLAYGLAVLRKRLGERSG